MLCVKGGFRGDLSNRIAPSVLPLLADCYLCIIFTAMNEADLAIELDNLLYDTCISHRECAEEIGIHRVGLTMYLNGKKWLDPDMIATYINDHKSDWVYDPDKLLTAIGRSELTQQHASKWLGVDAPYLSRLLNGHIRPGNIIYQRIKTFCLRQGVH